MANSGSENNDKDEDNRRVTRRRVLNTAITSSPRTTGNNNGVRGTSNKDPVSDSEEVIDLDDDSLPIAENQPEKVKAEEVEESEEEEEPKGLEGAAFSSRLPYDKMSEDESAAFVEIMSAGAIKLFCYLRNRIIQLWLDDPRKELTLNHVLENIDSPYNSDPQLIRRIYLFLDRWGYINFGVFKRENVSRERPTGRVLIIGGGIAGLAAAQQLQRFGMEPIILEARERIGGRIMTFRKGNFVADLGAMIITGLGGNPLAVLSKQINMNLARIKQKCPLFESTGETVPKEKDEMVEREFNRLLAATGYLASNLEFGEVNGKPTSLGQALEWLINLQETKVKKKQIDHLKEIIQLQEELKKIQSKVMTAGEAVKQIKSALKIAHDKQEAERTQSGRVTTTTAFAYRSKVRDLNEASKNLDRLMKDQQEIEDRLLNLESQPPSDVYFSSRDRQILDWHFANLEYANAAQMNFLSVKEWDQDDDFEFSGTHLSVQNGFSTITMAMADTITNQPHSLRTNCAVRKVIIKDDGVQVTTFDPNKVLAQNVVNPPETTISGDVVLCTLPLGVLKQSMLGASDRLQNNVQFDPPLPDWKLRAINDLGFGVLNKVILCWDKPFWDQDVNVFGHVGQTTASRGELFLFWNIYKSPVLMALVAGEAASAMEKTADDVIIARCLTILKNIYGNSVVPPPKDPVVTRWKCDPWSRGSWTYVACGASGNDFDVLAAPVQLPGSSEEDPPRLFFAGEHTVRNYPATVHGALLSGLREAAKIANLYLGCPYALDGQ